MADLINTGTPIVATEYGAALETPPPVFSGLADISRAAILGEDIAECIAAHGKIEMQALLAKGWTLEELERAEHAETRHAARGYTAKIEQLERASMIGLLIALAGATIILMVGLGRDLLLPGV